MMKQLDMFQCKDIDCKKGLLVGGHSNWQRKFKKNNPDVKVIDPDKSQINDMIKNSKILFICSRHISHRQYGVAIKLAKLNNIPIRYVK